MPYSVYYRPIKSRPGEPWVKVARDTGKVVSRHRSKAKAKASIRAYYATRNCSCACNAAHAGNWWDGLVLHASPLRTDPTRTSSLRKAFMREMVKAFGNLRRAVIHFMVELDALGLGARPLGVSFLTANLIRREFEFLTTDAKLSQFNSWFSQQVNAHILSPDPGTPAGLPWTTEFTQSAYKRGQINAYLATRALDKPVPATQEQFLRGSFGSPEAMSKVRLLGTRAFEQLKGVTATMSADMNRILAQGMADGKGPEAIAKEMAARITSLTNTRALAIARTEIINAHAEGQLDAFGKLGVEELGVNAEWSTARDERVCEQCAPLEGQVFSVAEARGLIPLHTNCRCSWVPTEAKVKHERIRSQIAESVTPPSRAVLEGNLEAAQRALEEAEAAQAALEEIERLKHAVALAQRAIRRDNKRLIRAGLPVPGRGAPSPPPPQPSPVPAPRPVTPQTPVAPAPAPLPPEPIPVQPPPAKPANVRFATSAEYRTAVSKAVEEAEAGMVAEIAPLRAQAKALRQAWMDKAGAAGRLGTAEASQAATQSYQTYATASQALSAAELRLVEAQKAAAWNILREEKSLAHEVIFPAVTNFDYVPVLSRVLETMPAGRATAEELYNLGALRVNQASFRGTTTGQYLKEQKLISLEKGYSNTTLAHEFGHHVSYQIPDIYKRQQAFFDMRTRGETVKGLPGYSRKVRGKKDDFGKTRVYAGRVYSDGRAPEVIAVGVEMLFDNPARFIKADPEYFDMIVGALKGL